MRQRQVSSSDSGGCGKTAIPGSAVFSLALLRAWRISTCCYPASSEGSTAASTGDVGELLCRRSREATALGCEVIAVDSEGTAEEKEVAWGEDDRTSGEGSGVLVDLFRRGVSNTGS